MRWYRNAGVYQLDFGGENFLDYLLLYKNGGR